LLFAFFFDFQRILMAGPTGLEPATSGVTGKNGANNILRANQLRRW
jgi:hypothetical protein